MPITLGILAQSRQAVAASDFVLLDTQVLGSAAASVTFSGLSAYASTYKHLQLRVVVRDTFTGGDGSTVLIRFNSDSGNNYAFHNLQGNGSSVASLASSASTNRIIYQQSSNGNFSAQVIDILDAFQTTKNKTVRLITAAPTVPYVGLISGLYMNTAAINTILLQTEGFNLAEHSRFSLYGIRG